MKNMTPAQRAELEARGAAAADWFEAEGPDPADLKPISELSPSARIRRARHIHAIETRDADEKLRRVVRGLNQAGYSWHKIGQDFGMTAEGARKKFSHA